MKLKQLAIKRQEDGLFVIVASIEFDSGYVRYVYLDTATEPTDLKESFMTYLQDEDTLQVEVQYQLEQDAM